MQAGTLRTLEFEAIVEIVSRLALTPTGADRLALLTPETDPQKVTDRLAATTETVRFLSAQPSFALRAPSDLRAHLESLAVQGRALEPVGLLSVADYLDSIDQARGAIRQRGAQFAHLKRLAEAAASFRSETADIRRKIGPSGEVLDQASTQLAGIRDRMRKQRSRLRGMLESYLRGRETARHLQEQVITERNGRFVLVVKAEHRASIPGIIHGSSSSGASLFLEPLSTVEINNDIVALEEQETQEIFRILLGLSDALRSRGADLARTIEAATELDALQAKARFAEMVRGVEPMVSTDGRFELKAARHPLLIPDVARRLDQGTERSADPVPVDIALTPPGTVLVISGPNTGGKTVALKTAGLLALMAQAGLHIPAAEGSRLPVFRSIFADIGDEQSIAANLSTFSGHMTHVATMQQQLALPSLVLLDEIGVGTDPVEGGALGVAIVDYFKSHGALVITTTHHEALKAYASTTPGVLCAAFGFEPESFAPTYHLTYGTPGRSLGLEIARRLGLDDEILAAATRNMSEREAQIAEHLARIDDDVRRLDHERRLMVREQETLRESETRLRSREEALRQREDATRRRFNDELDRRVREARGEIDAIVAELKRRTEELAGRAAQPAAPIVSTGEAGMARADARAALDGAIARLKDAAELPAPTPTADGLVAAVGDRVAVGALNLEGRVLSVHGGEAEIDVRGKRLRAHLRELRVIERDAPVETGRVNVSVQLQPREHLSTDLNVIGCTVDEALSRTERFLDESLLASERTVRVIHGYGTGQLRRALAEFFAQHPFVASFTAASPEQGGGGVTVVELKD
jgi:DNA mismatch repair protein MutS2